MGLSQKKRRKRLAKLKEPAESEVQRVSFVLMQFVKPWGLPLNPENLDLMASHHS